MSSHPWLNFISHLHHNQLSIDGSQWHFNGSFERRENHRIECFWISTNSSENIADPYWSVGWASLRLRFFRNAKSFFPFLVKKNRIRFESGFICLRVNDSKILKDQLRTLLSTSVFFLCTTFSAKMWTPVFRSKWWNALTCSRSTYDRIFGYFVSRRKKMKIESNG